jgi:hypothetical protein
MHIYFSGENMTGELLYNCDFSIDTCGANRTNVWTRGNEIASGRPNSGPQTDADGGTGTVYGYN